jgi:tetratricopeptide (TPR) repeat protein
MDSTSRASRLRQLKRLSQRPLTAFTIRSARQFLRDYPDDDRAWLILGMALSEAYRYEEAEQAFAKAIEFSPRDRLSVVYAQMGHLFQQSGNMTEAAVWYGRAVKGAADDATYHNLMGWLLARQGRLHDAEVCFRLATQCEHGNVEEAFFYLGQVLRSQERFAEAADCFRETLRTDPEYRPAGWALRDMERCLGIEHDD